MTGSAVPVLDVCWTEKLYDRRGVRGEGIPLLALGGTPADFLIGRFLVIVFCDPFGAPLEVLWTFLVPF